jgi:acetyltransferase-like isoleucine patch superfamily enzyme
MIGKLAIVARGWALRAAVLFRGSRISFGATVYIHRGATLNIGRVVRIGKGGVISVLPGATLTIHDGCTINNGSYIYVNDRVDIGANTLVAHYCSIVDHDYDFRNHSVLSDAFKRSAPIAIGSNVWLGAYVMVLKGVRIGDGAVVGAKALVSTSIPERSIAYSRACSELTIKGIETP